MKPSSAKAKGRTLQQLVCKALAELGAEYGLEAGDFLSRSMGSNGEDCIFSPAAIRVYGDLRVECKNVEKLNVPTVFYEHAGKYPRATPVLIHKRNHKPPLVTVTLTTYLDLLKRSTRGNHDKKSGAEATPSGETKTKSFRFTKRTRRLPQHNVNHRNGSGG